MKLKIFSPEDKKFRKLLNKYALLFFLVFPLINKMIIGTFTMFIDFVSFSYNSYIGVLAAQSLSVVSELLDKVLIMCGLCVLIYAIHRYTVTYCGKYALIAILSPFALFAGGLVSVYFLSVTGYHDITPIKFVSHIPSFLFSWILGYFELLILLCVASVVSAVYLSKIKVSHNKKGVRFTDSPLLLAEKSTSHYSKSVKATTIIYVGILVVTEIINLVINLGDADGFSANVLLEVIITPIIILAIRILLICLSAYLVSKHFDKKYQEIF